MQARGLWVVRKPQGKPRSLSVSPQRPQNSRSLLRWVASGLQV